MPAAIVDGRVGKELRSVPAAAVLSQATTRSPSDPMTLSVPPNLLVQEIHLDLRGPQDLTDPRYRMGQLKAMSPRDPTGRQTPTDPRGVGRLREVTDPLDPTAPRAPLDLPVTPGAQAAGSYN
jgi:hypothetical protein